MRKTKIISLYSGSAGNATLVISGGSAILIDAGKSARSLSAAIRAAGFDVDKIDAIFITHEHTDHISALEVLLKKHNIPVHMTEQSADKIRLYPGSALSSKIVRHPPHFSVELDGMRVFRHPTNTDFARIYDSKAEYSVIFGDKMGPAGDYGRLNTMVGYIYDSIKNHQGRASAAAFILFGIIFIVTMINLSVSKKKTHY
jgi:phosphoribosyl 1,2-cyclic phosphodiesterase